MNRIVNTVETTKLLTFCKFLFGSRLDRSRDGKMGSWKFVYHLRKGSDSGQMIFSRVTIKISDHAEKRSVDSDA